MYLTAWNKTDCKMKFASPLKKTSVGITRILQLHNILIKLLLATSSGSQAKCNYVVVLIQRSLRKSVVAILHQFVLRVNFYFHVIKLMVYSYFEFGKMAVIQSTKQILQGRYQPLLRNIWRGTPQHGKQVRTQLFSYEHILVSK